MNIKAKLFVFGEERELLHTDLNYRAFTDEKGKLTSALMGGNITVVFDAQMYDDYFIESMLDHRFGRDTKLRHAEKLYKTFEGKIVFYQNDQDQIVLFEYNFKDAVIIYFNEEFHREYGATVTITIAPAMQDYRFFDNSTSWQEFSTTRYMLPWKESYIPPKKTNKTNPTEDKKSRITSFHYENKKGDVIQPRNIKPNQEITLVLLTENAKGKKIKVDLNNKRLDFKHNNKIVKNDILTGIEVTGKETRVPLTAIEQKQ